MIKQLVLIFFISLLACNTGKLKIIKDLPKALNEVSGNETINNSDLIWMHNDGGNAPQLFGVNSQGHIVKTLNIKAKNNDWEDITSDKKGNLYIGDFGNNLNKRKNLVVLKINANSLKSTNNIDVERISFKYPNQQKFPPKKKNFYFDCEAFIFYNDSLYLFTKSRVNNDFGKTNLYKIPAKSGNHIAQFVSSFSTCPNINCWITGADISNDGKKVVLLTPQSILLFINFKSDNFFNGNMTEIPLDHISQKEGICFKDDNSFYITDENARNSDGYLYKINLKSKP